jgi:FeS assembly SUF system protein
MGRKLSIANEPTALPMPELPDVGTAERPYTPPANLSTAAAQLEDRVIKSFEAIYDPEIPVNIFELGLIYGVDVHEDMSVHVKMTLTAPNCPVAQSLPEDVRQAAANVYGCNGATIEVVWDPPWNRGMMTEEARLELNL